MESNDCVIGTQESAELFKRKQLNPGVMKGLSTFDKKVGVEYNAIAYYKHTSTKTIIAELLAKKAYTGDSGKDPKYHPDQVF